jgi:hypothetical protein
MNPLKMKKKFTPTNPCFNHCLCWKKKDCASVTKVACERNTIKANTKRKEVRDLSTMDLKKRGYPFEVAFDLI